MDKTLNFSGNSQLFALYLETGGEGAKRFKHRQRMQKGGRQKAYIWVQGGRGG